MKSKLHLSLLPLAFSLTTAHAALVVYEPFDYTVGTNAQLIAPTESTTSLPLVSPNGSSSGLGSDWNYIAATANATISTTASITSGSSAFPTQNTGNMVAFSATGNYAQPELRASLSADAISAFTPDVGSSVELWFSVLSETSANIRFTLQSPGGITAAIGYNAGSDTFYMLSTAQATIGSQAGLALADNEPFMMVGHMTLSRTATNTYVVDNDGFEAWLLRADADIAAITNGPSLSEQAESRISNGENAVWTGNSNRAISEIRLRPGLNSNTAHSAYDEIRIGTSLADVVVAVPEPAHYAGMLAALVGLFHFVCRRTRK